MEYTKTWFNNTYSDEEFRQWVDDLGEKADYDYNTITINQHIGKYDFMRGTQTMVVKLSNKLSPACATL